MQRKCLKCGHVNPEATGDALEACPGCGAIYSRVEAAAAARAAARSEVAPFQDSRSLPSSAGARRRPEDAQGYAEAMRAGTLYPTFRGAVGIVYLLGVVLAALFAVGALVVAFKASGGARMAGLFGGLFCALLIYFAARLWREMSLMLADLSDAAVRTARSLDRQ